jgi:DNA-binding NarL/FixJ family response regulator
MKQPKPPEPASPAKRVLVIDDHPIFRAGLVGLIKTEPELSVCGEAEDARQAMTAVQKLQPDIVLMDIGLPDKSGLDLLKDIHAALPEMPVLVISMHDETLFAERVLRAGGRGYLMKQEGPDKILQAIRKVISGKVSLSERASELLFDQMSSNGHRKTTSPLAKLTDREFEVLRLIGMGKDTHEIADALHLSTKTVDTHRAHVRDKLGLKNPTELVHYATRWVNEQA